MQCVLSLLLCFSESATSAFTVGSSLTQCFAKKTQSTKDWGYACSLSSSFCTFGVKRKRNNSDRETWQPCRWVQRIRTSKRHSTSLGRDVQYIQVSGYHLNDEKMPLRILQTTVWATRTCFEICTLCMLKSKLECESLCHAVTPMWAARFRADRQSIRLPLRQ